MVARAAIVVAALVAGCVIAAGAQQSPQQPPRDTSALPASTTTVGTGRISGRVLAGDTGRPIKRARVFLSAAELQGGRGVLTDDAGAFDFADLPAGRYTINASKSGFIQLSYGQRRPFQPGTPLQLGAGQQLKGVDFALPKGGVISGRVTEESGDVMPGVMVSVMRYQNQQGDRRLVPSGQGQTDDRGVYRIWGLNPGEYYVSAVARNENPVGRGMPANVEQIVQDALAGRGRGNGRGGALAGTLGPFATDDDQNQLMYAPTYYPGVGSAAEARGVNVGVSEEVTGIDFALQLVRTARVSGRVQNPDGSAPRQGNVNLMPQANVRSGGVGSNFGGRVGADGQFSIANVPPGLYTLRARNNDRDAPLSTSQPLSVSGDVSNVLVVLQTGATVSGTLVFQPGATSPPGDLSQVRISAPSTEPDENIGPTPNPRVNKDGTFTIEGVSVGSHVFRPNGGGGLRGWNLKSVTIDGRDVTDIPIAVRSGQRVNNVVMTFTDKINEINGSVTDAQGNAVTEYTVLAFSTNSSVWRPQSRQIATARPDQTGMFRIRNLPSGEYYVVTVDPSEQGEWFDPTYLDQHRGGASRVTVGDGDVRTQDFRVSR